MSMDNNYLTYDKRQYGMDHERYDWSRLDQRQAVQWPNDKKVALWINVNLQYFPLNQSKGPVKVPGGMTMPYPDLRHFSLREYGNRVGIFRVLRALEQRGLKASFAVNGRLAEKYPTLIQRVSKGDGEIICHGWQMDAMHYGGMDINQERELIQRSLDSVAMASGKPITGWLSPGKNESENTPDLLAECGFEYSCNWVNDDMPYSFNTRTKPLVAMPLSSELSDFMILLNNQHAEQSYQEQITDAFNLLLNEAEQSGGRILALEIHPWLLGHAHRIKYFEQALDYIAQHPITWSATPSEILTCWQTQQS